MKLYYSDTFELPLPENHRFPMAKYTLLRERVLASELNQSCELLLPLAATDDQLSLVHTKKYLDSIKSGSLTDLQIRRIGFPWSEEMVERSRRSTGASIGAARAASKDGISVNLAGGTHHAFADRGQGYCVFNDVCVAAKVAQREGLVRNVMIIDCDVHQGNGTASIAKLDQTLFAFSMHCEKNFPFQKTEGDYDIALPPATDDRFYENQLRAGMDKVFREFKTDFVFYLAGADPYVGDRLGLLSLSKPGLRRRDQIVVDYCRDQEIGVAISMAGGYAPAIEDIVDIHMGTIEVAHERYLKDKIAIG